ncbi:MAG: fumarylacetoacetate hydrolase family protein [Intrasporangiaceae bacterium]|nr:fumarylacetoacetate hydrolase family protein [Intrasporangiaceae bacterium]
MRLCSITRDGQDQAAVVRSDGALSCVPTIAPDLPADLLGLLTLGLDQELRDRLAGLADSAAEGEIVERSTATLAPLYRHPRKIWGIGLNYRAHADDLGAPYPTEPASFMKGDHTIIGPDEDIVLPPQSERVTAEAELGVIIGRHCRDVDEAEALSYVAGVCPVLDQTAEDILGRNPRFLTRSKNFPTFFSFGPELVTTDEVLERFGSIDDIVVSTEHNGALHRENIVSDMTFRPAQLVSFHSQVMPLFPGDIISTGTPGAVVIEDGDRATCRIDGIGTLHNPVVRPGGAR